VIKPPKESSLLIFCSFGTFLLTFCGKRNTQLRVTTITPTPHDFIQRVPRLVTASLVQCLQTAYSISDQIATDFPILEGPHQPTILGWLRFVLVNNVVAKGVEEGLVPGTANWYPITNSSGHFMEYAYEGNRITFASTSGMYKIPKNSNFRLSRANENQLSLFPSDDKASGDDGPALLMLHGYKALKFAQLMVPGDFDGRLIALSWSPNILGAGEDGVHSELSSGGVPVNPIPAEPLAEIALTLRTSSIQILKNTGNQ